MRTMYFNLEDTPVNTQAPPPPNANEAPVTTNGQTLQSKLSSDLETAAAKFKAVVESIEASGSRELSLAKTKIEEAVMWAKAHIAKL